MMRSQRIHYGRRHSCATGASVRNSNSNAVAESAPVTDDGRPVPNDGDDFERLRGQNMECSEKRFRSDQRTGDQDAYRASTFLECVFAASREQNKDFTVCAHTA